VVSGIDSVQAQTKEHIFLARILGVTQLIVAINKMDATEPAYSEKRFEEVKAEVIKQLKNVGYKTDELPVVPISAYAADNVAKKSDKLGWHKGPTLLDALNGLKEPPKLTDKPLRLPVQDVYSITGIGLVPVGRVETGVLKPEMKIMFEPAHKGAEVKSIEMHHEQIPQAVPGDNVGFNVRGLNKGDIRRGDVAGPADNPPKVVKEFSAQITVLNHPSAITVGYTPVFHAHTAQVAGTFVKLEKKLDPKTGATKEENPEFIKTGDAAVVRIKPTKPMVLENAKEFPQLGRFAIRDMGQTVAAGVCIATD
jgi:elongation factor 1-alpha